MGREALNLKTKKRLLELHDIGFASVKSHCKLFTFLNLMGYQWWLIASDYRLWLCTGMLQYQITHFIQCTEGSLDALT